MVYLSKMVIFHGYVKLPEGNGIYGGLIGFNGDLLVILWWFNGIYPLVISQFAMENHHF